MIRTTRATEFMGLFLIVLFTVTVSAAECSGTDATDISGEELAGQEASESRLTVVDVRSSGEYKSGHIPGAINIPFWAMLTRNSEIPTGHDEPVVIYCEHGTRATLAKLFMKMAGFEQVVYLTGHMSSWRKAGLPVETPASPQ